MPSNDTLSEYEFDEQKKEYYADCYSLEGRQRELNLSILEYDDEALLSVMENLSENYLILKSYYKLTNTQVADFLGCSLPYVTSFLANAEKRSLGIWNVYKLSRLFNVSIDYLLTKHEFPKEVVKTENPFRFQQDDFSHPVGVKRRQYKTFDDM